MKYRLSLDLGAGSIGAAVLPLDENRVTEILDAGICIFKTSEGAEERRLKRSQRKNTERTRKRLLLLSEALAEAGLWSFDEDVQADLINLSPYRIRAQGVNGKLNNIMELGRAILHIAKHRGAGFVEMQELELELEKTRANNDDEDVQVKKKEPSEYAKLMDHLDKNEAQTIGEYFYMRLNSLYKRNNIKDKNRRYVRQRKGLADKKAKVDYAIPRYLVKKEFSLLWDKQAEYYKQLKDKKLKNKIYDILFYEYDHRPYATGKCIFIKEEPRLSKAHPLSEKRRIYEAVNNIRIQTLTEQVKLEKSQRDLIVNELLLKGKKAGKRAIKDLLKSHFGENFKVVLSDMIMPYLYSTPEYQAVDFINNLDNEKLAGIVEFMAEPKKENDVNYLYNDDQVVEILKEKFGIDNEKQISQLIAMLPKGRNSLGLTATQEILKLLENDVISIREATDKLAKTDKRFIAEEERARKLQGKYDKLPYYGEVLKTDTQPIADWYKEINRSLNNDEREYGKIANPAVHRMLNQLRKVVNDIIRIYGKPYDINLELAREVGMSSKRKKRYEDLQKENQEKNKKAVEYLKEHKIRITRINILKWRLANEQNWKDVFSKTLDKIHPKFEGFEIEHLIPDSLGGTDAPINRVLIKRSDNLNKGNMYPYDYLQQKHGDKVYGILKEIRTNNNMPDGKKWRFESDAQEKFESGDNSDNITRYLSDTSYFCKLAARYLKAIVDYKQGDENNTRVLTVNGGHTAKLRGIWNLDGIEYDLMGLNEEVPEYLPSKPYYLNKDTGEILYQDELDVDGNWEKQDKIKNPDWEKKPRIDHRNHIVDAIAIGMLSRSDMQKVNWHDKRGYETPFKLLPVPLSKGERSGKQKQLEIFRKKVGMSLKNIRVYHKPEHSKSSRLHEETGRYALMTNPDDPNKVITRYNRPITRATVLKDKSSLSNLLINTNTIKPNWHADIARDVEKMIRLKAVIESHYKQAESELREENQQLADDAKKAKNISEAMILQRAFQIACDCKEYKYETYPVYENSESLIYIDKHRIAYKGGGNHRIDFYQDDKNEIGWECIRLFDANNRNFRPQWKQKGFKPIWSIQQGDIIELDTPQQWGRYIAEDRCFAIVKNFSEGKIAIRYCTDAREENRKEKKLLHIKQDIIADKGLRFCSKSGFRKIELTPFGKIKRKHKKLWNGKKKTVKQFK
ncbi:MAG: type II CRISPR RNA-guided endonuclease Cas9 [Sedimentisphaerales bacterium]|nr:type II CRISPR RNA-guided endonuclease Cas9 [Sedimentisphaerales bacterium]